MKKTVNIAHRGGKCLAPENTIVGFREGRRVGADVLELEVHLTADEHLVLIHDDTVDRTTDGKGLIREKTLQEVKRLDAGYTFPGQGHKTYPYRGQGVVVPTLEEVYQEFPDVPTNAEIKEAQPGIEQALWQAIEEAEAAERTLVVSGNMRIIRRFREVSDGKVATGPSLPEMLAFILCSHLYLSCPLRPSYQALQVWKGVGTLRIVQTAHRSDIRVDV